MIKPSDIKEILENMRKKIFFVSCGLQCENMDLFITCIAFENRGCEVCLKIYKQNYLIQFEVALGVKN